MRVLLVNPPNRMRSIPEEKFGLGSFKRIFRGEPLGLEVVAANLIDHDVRILDLKVDDRSLSTVLDHYEPDVVGLTGVTSEAKTVLELARTVKSRADVPVVAGGIQATYDPDYYNRPEVDWIVIGLGTDTFRGLVDALEAGRPTDGLEGLARTNPGGALAVRSKRYGPADVADHLAPRYDLTASYRSHYTLGNLGLMVGYVHTSLGCPHRCAFCSIHQLTGGRYLTRSVDSVIRDIGLLPDQPVIRFVDANTFVHAGQSLELADAVLAEGLKKRYAADVRADAVARRPDIFERWAKAGLRYAVIGLEETVQTRLDAYNKKCDLEQNEKAVAVLKSLDVKVVGDFIVSPDYTEDDFDALEAYIDRLGIDIPMLTVLTPLPGTPLYEESRDRIVIDDLDYYTLTNAVTPTAMDEEQFYRRYAGIMNSRHPRSGM
jgi:radical SAM superfamily enzyme YgiQ (UPF0313 family)